MPDKNVLTREISELVAKIIKLPLEKINPQANLFNDLGIDSLVGVEIFAAIDKKYRIEVPENKLRSVQTIADLVATVQGMLNK
ncbi:hypothetical protein A2311_03640 [candidate division WOR-1 bacterium RIFOXYB2_FULL_48_7]|uniref:Carrier domain-containing protein n=1 Tax=candidate division WOR-1 bacterium RIFOXYB2_FULL_48_7 TaxID=1802583 RepID=A0A1F4TSD7_UNCSA|nr:MAG: hypothetical protein A2311_03640 [candidate division WOR-1 bacterium RIFOXYB2_FULL_48_7]